MTVHSKRQQIDLITAPREVLLSVPGAGAGEIEALMAARARMQGPIPRELLPIPVVERQSFALSENLPYTVRAEARTQAGAVFVREIVVELTGKTDQPFQLLAWRQGTQLPHEDGGDLE